MCMFLCVCVGALSPPSLYVCVLVCVCVCTRARVLSPWALLLYIHTHFRKNLKHSFKELWTNHSFRRKEHWTRKNTERVFRISNAWKYVKEQSCLFWWIPGSRPSACQGFQPAFNIIARPNGLCCALHVVPSMLGAPDLSRRRPSSSSLASPAAPASKLRWPLARPILTILCLCKAKLFFFRTFLSAPTMYWIWEGAEKGTGGKPRSPGKGAMCRECIMQPCVGAGSRAGGRPVCFESSIIALMGGSTGGGEGGERVRQSERRPGRSRESTAWQGAGLSSAVLYVNVSTGVCLLTMMRSLAPACSFVPSPFCLPLPFPLPLPLSLLPGNAYVCGLCLLLLAQDRGP